MPTVRIIRFDHKTSHREEFKFTDQQLLFEWWLKEDKNDNVYLTVHSFATPPTVQQIKQEHENLDWCPYCQDWRVFSTFDDIERCPVCMVSENEYYVRKYNYRIADNHGEIEHADN